MTYYKIDENHNIQKCTAEEWSKNYEFRDRHVDWDEIEDHKVSTVWLGLDHNYSGEGDPLLFETMIFNPQGNDIYCRRYSTWEEAEDGHQIALMHLQFHLKQNAHIPKFSQEQIDHICYQIGNWYTKWKDHMVNYDDRTHRLGYAKEQLKELICGKFYI